MMGKYNCIFGYSHKKDSLAQESEEEENAVVPMVELARSGIKSTMAAPKKRRGVLVTASGR